MGLLSLFQIAPPFIVTAQDAGGTGSLEAWTYATLVADGAVAAIVGTRVFEDVVPQNQGYPAITYSVVGEDREYTTDNTNSQIVNRLQVTAWTATGKQRRQLSDAICDVLDGYRGASHGKTIQSCMYLDQTNVTEQSPGNAAQKLFGKHIDFEVTHVGSTPDRSEE